MDAFEILVVILSLFLAIFLVLAILLTVHLIKVMRKLDELAQKANSLTQKFSDNVLDLFKKSITPSVIASGLFQFVRKTKKRAKEDNKE